MKNLLIGLLFVVGCSGPTEEEIRNCEDIAFQHDQCSRSVCSDYSDSLLCECTPYNTFDSSICGCVDESVYDRNYRLCVDGIETGEFQDFSGCGVWEVLIEIVEMECGQ
jgi:hypothetical protein